MGRAEPLPEKLTVEAYLEREDAAEYKSEYYKGEVFAMSGAKHDHVSIVANLLVSLRDCLKKKGCWVGVSDLRVHIPTNSLFTYPDVVVVCGAFKYYDGRRNVVLNPSAIIEVLSPTTRDYDKGTKFELYRAIESLNEYVVVDSEQWQAERWYRADGTWHLDPDTARRVSVGGCELSLDAVYEGVGFGA